MTIPGPQPEPQPEPGLPRRSWVEQVMGLPVSIQLRGPQVRDSAADDAVGAVCRELHRIDDLFSTYQDASQVSRLRRGELVPADCDDDVRQVARLCELAKARTGGWFDAELPTPDLPDPKGVTRFDPTGLVKGWAIERACDALSAALPGHDVMINGGGDIALRCARTDTPDFVVGIEDPADRSQLLATTAMRCGAVATSGSAARGDHVFDPHTGLPARGLRSVTVIGPSLLWADVYATAAFAQGPQCTAWLATLPGHLAFVVDSGGATRTVHGDQSLSRLSADSQTHATH